MAKTPDTTNESKTRAHRDILTDGLDLPKMRSNASSAARNLAVMAVIRKSKSYEDAAQAAAAYGTALAKCS